MARARHPTSAGGGLLICLRISVVSAPAERYASMDDHGAPDEEALSMELSRAAHAVGRALDVGCADQVRVMEMMEGAAHLNALVELHVMHVCARAESAVRY